MALLIYKLISTTVVEFLRIGKDKTHLIGLPISDYDKELKSKKNGHRHVHRAVVCRP